MAAATVFIKHENLRSGSRWTWTIAELIALALIPLFAYLSSQLPAQVAGHPLATSTWSVFLQYSGAAPAFAAIVLVTAFERGAVSSFLLCRPLVLLGEVSFALYLVHQLLISFFYMHLPIFRSFPDLLNLAGYWCITFVVAFALWAGIEKPFRRRIKALFFPLQ
jgi:peptidoglycan/LPS O-acetylase OafA/YrhL